MTSTQPSTQLPVHTHTSVDSAMKTPKSLASIEAKERNPEIQVRVTPADMDRGSGRVQLGKPLASSKSRRSKVKQPLDNNSIRLIAIGSRQSLINNMKRLHLLNYADFADWSKLQRGPNPGEFMSVLTLRLPHP